MIAMKDKLMTLLFVFVCVAVLLLGCIAALAVTRYACQTIGRWAGIAFIVAIGGSALLFVIILIQMWRETK